ncbi:MAG: phospholipase A [Pararobbsia sp.]
MANSKPRLATPHRSHHARTPGWLPVALAASASLSLCWAPAVHATVTLLQPPRELAGGRPLTLTLLLAQDEPGAQRYEIPATLEVRVVTTDGMAPRTLTLHHAPNLPAVVTLEQGQYRKVDYDAPWPNTLRGTLRLEPVGFDAAQSIVVLDWSERATANATVAAAPLAPLSSPVAAPASTAAGSAEDSAKGGATADTLPASGRAIGAGSAGDAATHVVTAPESAPGTGRAAAHASMGTEPLPDSGGAATHAVTAAERVPGSPSEASADLAAAPAPLGVETSRLSFNEPVYFAVGASGDTTAKFQLSFKYRIFQPQDSRSRSLVDNLYFGYTQLSLWDLSEESKPFKDTNFRPSLFYYLPDTGLRASWFSRLGVQAGIEHESNGRDGSDSRSINTIFVRPTLTWNNVLGNRLVVSPKFYYYLEKSENPDIARYRGYTDLLIKYGNPDGLELATTLRKGSSNGRGSIDAQLTYPMQKLFGAGFGGYVWLGGFSGYGETLIDYNRRTNAVRLGFSISR